MGTIACTAGRVRFLEDYCRRAFRHPEHEIGFDPKSRIFYTIELRQLLGYLPDDLASTEIISCTLGKRLEIRTVIGSPEVINIIRETMKRIMENLDAIEQLVS